MTLLQQKELWIGCSLFPIREGVSTNFGKYALPLPDDICATVSMTRFDIGLL